jgi:dTDP-4-amino-4,6-dideoxygalactose transaminase
VINQIAEKNNLIIVEDSAQSHGAISNLKSKINNQAQRIVFIPEKILGL